MRFVLHQPSVVCIKIETYWNVNVISTIPLFPPAVIKIETYWNVNVLYPP